MHFNFFYLQVLLLLALASCRNRETVFEVVSSSHSGITFNNEIVENDSINPLDLVNVYNGGGVGIGDFNNDGRQDIYFIGNIVANKMYLNKGDFKFEDVTEQSNTNGLGRWGRGVAVVDINNDGWLDLYIANTISKDSLKRQNTLYVNQGVGKNNIPHFKEMAHEYGLDVRVQSTMASFFDYDNDGDLDVYLTVNEATSETNPNTFGTSIQEGLRSSTGRLYRNDFSKELNHPVYTNVSSIAGIKLDGYGHTATIVDINMDGWKDISVANDFVSSNILYINNKNGTFTNKSKEYFKHTSYNSMGQDIVDINNDGLADLFELDMFPEDNNRKKMMLMPNSDQTFQNFNFYGYQIQYVRNTLQLNQGPRVGQNDSIGEPIFSEIAFMGGIAETDWSWTPLMVDFDNDTYRDIVITNGFPKDVTDRDFLTYRAEAFAVSAKKTILSQIPVIKLNNYAYRNKGDLTFENVTNSWGLDKPTFSNGAAYADLNNDGALDMIINNINDEALIYKNMSAANREEKVTRPHYLQIKFLGNGNNRNGLGCWADIYYDNGKHQVFENNPFRGYLSTHQNISHFGLGATTELDSVVIRWPNGKKQVLVNVKSDQLLTVNISNAEIPYSWSRAATVSDAIFTEVTNSVGINYKHKEYEFTDFTIQKLLPHKLSEYSPGLAVGDIDNNGLDDLIIGGNGRWGGQKFLQQKNGKFKSGNLYNAVASRDFNDEGLILFDANGDGFLDLYIASGGYNYNSQHPNYQDRIYTNDGKGNFELLPSALPQNYTSKLCVRAFDYNKDGKMDLFVSGRVDPWNYPKPVSSFIFRNDSKNGKVQFTDVTDAIAPDLKNLGLVCDALFSDFDDDGWPDLVLAGEWMPVTILKNQRGKFTNATSTTGLGDKPGWWNTIVAGDFRHTGRMDYIVGNTGLNTLYKASEQYPVYITAKDFDGNGSYAAIPSVFFPDKDGIKREFPAHGRDDILKQMISFKSRFTNYKSFAEATMNEVLTKEQRSGALRLKANELRSMYVRNDGNGKFTMIPLPKEAQISALNGMVVDDFNGDRNLDVAISGNDFGTEVSTGRYDALNGLILLGDGKGEFRPLSILESGFFIPGNGKALVSLTNGKGEYLLAGSQNKDALKVFQLNRDVKTIRLLPTDVSVLVKYSNGVVTKREIYYGSSFLSQSARFVAVDKHVSSIIITDFKGVNRTISFNYD